MVWSFGYEPAGSSLPSAEPVPRDWMNLRLEDETRDGGGGLATSRSFSGRRAKAESLPKAIRWLSKRETLDYENAWVASVTDRLRALIEEIEPGIHQFEPLRFLTRDGAKLEKRWFWQICNRLDTVSREHTKIWLLKGSQWGMPSVRPCEEPILVFETDKIGEAKFWHDKFLSASKFMSDDTKVRIEKSGFTGFRFKAHYKQV